MPVENDTGENATYTVARPRPTLPEGGGEAAFLKSATLLVFLATAALAIGVFAESRLFLGIAFGTNLGALYFLIRARSARSARETAPTRSLQGGGSIVWDETPHMKLPAGATVPTPVEFESGSTYRFYLEKTGAFLVESNPVKSGLATATLDQQEILATTNNAPVSGPYFCTVSGDA